MELKLNLTIVLIVLFIIHTIFTHLLNWFLRESHKDDMTGLALVLTIVEFALCITAIICISR